MKIAPPEGLSKPTAKWWRSVREDFNIEDAAGLALLTAAARALDRAEQARKLIDEHGVAVKDRFGQLRSNPAVAAERDAQATFRASLRELGLDLEPIGRVGRPGGR